MTQKLFFSHIDQMLCEYDLQTGSDCRDTVLQDTAQWADIGKTMSNGGPATTVSRNHWGFCSAAAFLLSYAARKVYRYESVYAMLRAYDQNADSHRADEVISHPDFFIGSKEFPFYASAAALLLDARTIIDAALPADGSRKIQFRGFRSISEFEHECIRFGYTTERIPCQRYNSDVKYFVLIVGCPTASGVDSWHLFTADETAEILSGIISHRPMSGVDINYTGKLAAYGFCTDALQPAPVSVVSEYPISADGQICFRL